MSQPILHTSRLTLNHVGPEQTDALFAIFSRKDVTQYYGMLPLTDPNQAKQMIHSFQQTFEAKRGIRWGIFLKGTSKCIGTIGLNLLSSYHRKAEIGYELHPDHWRKGIISEAAEAVIAYSFSELDLLRIGAVTFAENTSSQQLLTKLGFELEGICRNYFYVGEHSADAHLYSIIAP